MTFRVLVTLFLLSLPVAGQNPRGILPGHPRIHLNNSIPDTWMPSQSRLSAVLAKATGKGCSLANCGQATADFKALRALIDSSTYGNCSHAGAHTSSCGMNGFLVTSNGNVVVNGIAAMALMYRVLLASDPGSANAYAAGIVKWVNTVNWATEGSIYFSNTPDHSGYASEALAVAYDWINDYLVAQGLTGAFIADMKHAFKTMHNAITNQTTGSGIRESDYHNYVVPNEVGMLMIGLAMAGDDPAADAYLDEGAGLLGIDPGGYPINPTGFAGDVYRYNVKVSIDALTGGAMNWEGPQYWRNAVPSLVRGIEAYDSATGRSHQLWRTSFSTLYRGIYYRLYSTRPDGASPGVGDATAPVNASGKDQIAMVLLMDAFAGFQDPALNVTPSRYAKTWIDNAVGKFVNWNTGSNVDGLLEKLLWYDYGAMTPAPLTDLPLSMSFGKETYVRSGWCINWKGGSSPCTSTADTHLTFSAGYSGQYHSHLDQGSFLLYHGADLVLQGSPYSVAGMWGYQSYMKRSIAGNVVTVYRPGENWYDNQNVPNLSSNGYAMTNDGGQRWIYRRYDPPWPSHSKSCGLTPCVFQIARLWSATMLTDPKWTSYNFADTFLLPPLKVKSYPALDYISADLTKAYTDAFSGHGSNQTANVAQAPNSMTRDIVFHHAGRESYVVVFDRVVSTDPTYPKSWLLHTIGAPQLGSGSSWSAATVGITNYTSNALRTDSGPGRLYVSTLLPASPNVRVVGGNSCTPIQVPSVSSPGTGMAAVFHYTCGGSQCPANTLVNGEWIATAGFSGSGNWSGIAGLDSSNVAAWGFQIFNVTPTTFQATRFDGHDVQVDGTGYRPTVASFPANVTISYHTNCGYEALVDDYPSSLQDNPGLVHNNKQNFPNGVQTNLWPPINEHYAKQGSSVARWRIEIKPRTPEKSDYFLNVLYPTATSKAAPPATVLLSGPGVYGSQITDSAGSYIALFPTTAKSDGYSITTTFTGQGQYVATGLATGLYDVTVNGVSASSAGFPVGEDGTIAFSGSSGTVAISKRRGSTPRGQ